MNSMNSFKEIIENSDKTAKQYHPCYLLLVVTNRLLSLCYRNLIIETMRITLDILWAKNVQMSEH